MAKGVKPVTWRTVGDGGAPSGGGGGGTSAVAGVYNGVTSGRDLTGFTVKNLMTDYGALGAGGDDAAALQSALNGACTAGFALYIPTPPSGKFRSSTSLTIPSGRHDFRIYGDGPDLSIIEPYAANSTGVADTAIIFQQNYNFKLYDFATKAVNQVKRTGITTGRGFHFDVCHDAEVRNVLAKAVSGAAFLWYRSYNWANRYCSAIDNLSDAFHCEGLGTANGGYYNCLASNTGDDSFAFIGGDNRLTNMECMDCESYDAWWASGVHFEGVNGGKSYRNKIYRSGGSGFQVDSQSAFTTGACDSIDSQDDYFEGCLTRGFGNALVPTGHGSIQLWTNRLYVHGVAIQRATIVNPATGPFVKVTGKDATNDVTSTFDNCTLTGTGTAFTVNSFASALYTGRGNTKNGVAL